MRRRGVEALAATGAARGPGDGGRLLCRMADGEGRVRVGVRRGSTFAEVLTDADAPLSGLLSLPLEQIRGLLADAESRLTEVEGFGGWRLLKPADLQEVWAAGVTYERSRDARVEESGQRRDVYEDVYLAERPELFFKATPGRTVGPGEEIRIRGDSVWDVPEPELAVHLNRDLEVVGYSVGNDVSSRAIEGENPLYLPQAKIYVASCAIGPWIVPAWQLDVAAGLDIELVIERDGEVVFAGSTNTRSLRRDIPTLVEYLGRDNEFPQGVVLLTGTGIVPPQDVTLEAGDVTRITIEGIGTLANPVRRGDGRRVAPASTRAAATRGVAP